MIRLGISHLRYTVCDTAWGPFGFVARGRRVFWSCLPQRLGDARKEVEAAWPEAAEDQDLLPRFQREVMDYFDGKVVRFSVSLDLTGVTAFRQAVLEQCRRIPYGKTASYRDLARAVGKPGAARAAGSAMANNPVPLVIPCHRVVRADGSIGCFSTPAGTLLKRRLIRMEHDAQAGRRADRGR